MPRGDYESIPTTEDPSSSASSPLDNSSHWFRNNRTKLLLLASGCVVVVVTLILGSTTYHTTASSSSSTTILPVERPHDSLPSVRPLCEIHSNRYAVQVLQTSMATPSQTWATVACVPRHIKTTEPLNEYARPDAILQTNLSSSSSSSSSTRRHSDSDSTNTNKPPIVFPHSPIRGFGGAFTEAAARNFQQLTEPAKETVLELLFGATGLGYSLGRLPINSCDFSVASYSFDDTVDDFHLTDFDTGVHHDVASGMVDLALRAVSTLRQAYPDEPDMFLLASPWSPPAWMKIPTYHYGDSQSDADGNHVYSSMTGSAQPNCLKDGVGPDSAYARAWAQYFSQFLTAYRNLGLPLQAVTVQNEPEFPAPWEACAYDPPSQHDFVAHHLGPQLRRDHPDVKILMFDHNKDHINKWVDVLLRHDSLAKPFIDGTAYHWYAGGMDRLLDGALGIPNMHRLQDQLQQHLGNIAADHLVLGSESCHCPTTGYAGGDIQIYWSRAERYAHTILADLAAGSHGWIEWNLLLDGIGGPNHLGNLCESTLLAVPHRAVHAPVNAAPLPPFESQRPFGNVSIGDGRTREELNALGFPAQYLDLGVAVQPLYYYMGHISKHVRPGSFALPALVQQSLDEDSHIFRPAGSVVAGGGQNDLARNGIEITLWPCEGSTRQQFDWSNAADKYIRVHGHDWKGVPTTSCVARDVDTDFRGFRLTECTAHAAGVFDIVPYPDGYYRIKLLNAPSPQRHHHNDDTNCLVVQPLAHQGGAYGPRGGAQVALGACESENDVSNSNDAANPKAQWKWNPNDGQLSSDAFFVGGAVCWTTGWPFLQMGAFHTPDGKRTVVVLNEANDPANFALRDGDLLVMTSSIPARSIQTILLSST